VSDASTYDRKRLAKRKDETPDAYDGDVGRQERNGGEKVQEGRVCSEALYRATISLRAPTCACVFIFRNRKDDARCILHPSRDSGDLAHSVSRWWGITAGHAEYKGARTHPF